MVLLAACASESVGLASESGGDTAATAQEPPPCVAPGALAPSPVAVVATADPMAEGGPRTHLIEIERADGALYASGTGGFFVFEEAGLAWVNHWSAGGELSEVEPLSEGRVLVANRDAGLAILQTTAGEATPVVTLAIPDLAGASLGGALVLVEHTGALTTRTYSRELTEIGRLEGLGNPWDVVLDDGVAWVADNALGLVAVDVSTPAAPTLLAEVPTGGPLQNLDLDGPLLAAAVGSAGVEIYDIADPAAPVLLGGLDLGATVVDVSLDGGLLWTAELDRVRVIDVSDPTTPVPLASFVTAEWAMEVTSAGPDAWVAAWGQLVHLRLSEGEAPDVSWSRASLPLSGAGPWTVSGTNLGAAGTEVVGWSVDDPRFEVAWDTTALPPGGSATATVSFVDNGADVAATLCLATGDPDAPVVEIPVTRGGAGEASVAIGEPAPDFVLPDLDGGTHPLSSQLGRPVVLVYFATW